MVCRLYFTYRHIGRYGQKRRNSFGYESWLITRKDGTVVSGFLRADGETVVIKGMDGQVHTIKAAEIAARKQFATSIMPEPAALGLDQTDLANLLTYLLTLKAD